MGEHTCFYQKREMGGCELVALTDGSHELFRILGGLGGISVCYFDA